MRKSHRRLQNAGRDFAVGRGDGLAQRWHKLLWEQAEESRAGCISCFAGALQNGLERERGTGLRCVLRQEVGVRTGWLSLGSGASSASVRWMEHGALQQFFWMLLDAPLSWR